ncbi:cytochrome c [Myxococcota bacterium]|nr:cytochrome c [Myxococcota bacterium]
MLPPNSLRSRRVLIPVALTLTLAGAVLAGMPTKRPEDHVRGRTVFMQSCWQCHGASNNGQGPAAEALVGGVPDLRGKMSEDRFDALIPIILEGKGKMPAYAEELDKHDARRVLVYLHRLDTGEETPPAPPKAPKAGQGDEDEPKGEEGAVEVAAPPGPSLTPGMRPPTPTLKRPEGEAGG